VKAVVYSGYGITPTLRQVSDPACPDDGAVLAVGATGVCRSDWHAWKGHEPVGLPHIPVMNWRGWSPRSGRVSPDGGWAIG
jgi:alcohol dehydrogenase